MNANTYGHGPLAEHAEAPQAAHAASEWGNEDRTQPEGAGFVWVPLGSALVIVVLAVAVAVMP